MIELIQQRLLSNKPVLGGSVIVAALIGLAWGGFGSVEDHANAGEIWQSPDVDVVVAEGGNRQRYRQLVEARIWQDSEGWQELVETIAVEKQAVAYGVVGILNEGKKRQAFLVVAGQKFVEVDEGDELENGDVVEKISFNGVRIRTKESDAIDVTLYSGEEL